MINVIHEGGGYAVWLDNEVASQDGICLAVHKRERFALLLARRALINAIMAVEQKVRMQGRHEKQKAIHH